MSLEALLSGYPKGPRSLVRAGGLPRSVVAFAWSGVRAVGYAVAEARNGVTVLNVLRVYAGAAFSVGLIVPIPAIVLPLLSWAGVSIACYALNGCTDVAADRANGSTRPIASGRLSLPAAYAATGVIALLALGIASSVSAAFLAHVVGGLMLGAAYSVGPSPLKNHTVTAACGMCIGVVLSLNAGRAAVDGPMSLAFVCVIIASALWIAGAAVAKDISDIDGDTLAGRSTYAATAGLARAQYLATLLMCLGTVPIAAGAVYAPILRLPAVAVAVLVGLQVIRSMYRTSQRSHLTSLMSVSYLATASSLLI